MGTRIIYVVNTKTDEKREIPVNTVLYAMLVDLRTKSDAYVFPNDAGEPYVDIRKGFRTAMKKSYIGNFRFHDLRHTFASQLVMKGVDLRTVQELLGHKSIEMTVRYAHLFHRTTNKQQWRDCARTWTLFGHQSSKDVNSRIYCLA